MYDIMVYERALYVPHSGDFDSFSVSRMCCGTVCGVGPCVLFTLCTLVERWVVGYCTVSDIGGAPMTICTYHYRMERPH